MKLKLLVFAFTLLSTMLFSQSQNMAFEEWKNNTGTQNLFYKITPVTSFKSGDTYVAGATVTMNGTTDILLTKYYANGTFAWTQQYNGLANAIDFAAGIYIDNSDNIYITGTVSNDTNNVLLTDLILIKYDADGIEQWVATYDGGVGGLDIGKDIIVDDSNGNVYVTGGSHNSSYNSDILMICFDVSGVQQWVSTKDYNSLDDVGYKISMPRGPSELLVTGAFTSSTNNYKLANIEVDASNGHMNTITTSTAVTTSSVDVVNDVVFDAQKNIYITGGYNVSGQGLNYYTMKMDSNLVIQWQQYYNGTSNLNDVAKGLDVDNSGNVYVTGYSTSSTQGRNFVTIKYNSAGSQQWVQTFSNTSNTDDEASDVVVDSLLNVYVTGSTMSSLNQSDYYTIKYNSAGTKIWDIQTDAHHLNDKATNLVVDINNDIIITGQCETAPNAYEYNTVKYVQKDVLVPVDLNSEPKNQQLSFTPNLGQLHDTGYVQNTSIKYYNTTLSPAVFIKENLNSFMFNKTNASGIDSLYRFDLVFSESNSSAKPYPIEPVNEWQNFYTVNTGADGITNVFANGRLFVPDIYPNVDLHYYSNENGLKYYFVVKPGGNPASIIMHFNGCVNTFTNGSNQLIARAPWDALSFNVPQIYQLNAGSTVTVSGTPSWNSIGSNSYKFTLPSYNTSLPLVIMVSRTATTAATAQTGAWRTYIGGYNADVAQDVVTDKSANVYVSGYAEDLILYQGNVGNAAMGGFRDAMLIKFDKDAHWVWSNIYGGNGAEEFRSLTYSKFNNDSSIYLTGTSTSKTTKIKIWPATNPSNGSHWDDQCAGAGDAIIARVDVINGSLIYSQYLGGCNDDRGLSITADNVRGRIYVTGTVDDHFSCGGGAGFPFTNPGGNSYYTSTHGNPTGSEKDAFIFVINLNNMVQYSTLLGGNLQDDINEVAVNQSTGNFYITGSTSSGYSVRTNGGPYGALNDGRFPLCKSTNGYFQTTKTQTYIPVSYVARFNQNYELHWSTYFVGQGEGFGTGLDVAPNGDVYATGVSYATSTSTVNCGVPNDNGFPVCNPYQSAAYGASPVSADIYFGRFNNIDSMTYATLYGNDDDENPTSQMGPKLCVEKNNHVFITGATKTWGTSNAFPVLNKTGLYNQASNGTSPSANAFILWFDPSNTRTWASHYGGPGNGSEYGNSVAVFGSTQLYMVGSAGTYSLPLACPPQVGAPPFCKNNNSNSQDAFLCRFDMGTFIGIEEYQGLNTMNELFIYPNPANSNISIIFKGRELDNYSLEIYNMLGQVVYKKDLGKTFGNRTEVVDVSSYTSGMYIINLVSSKEILSAKLIKQ